MKTTMRQARRKHRKAHPDSTGEGYASFRAWARIERKRLGGQLSPKLAKILKKRG